MKSNWFKKWDEGNFDLTEETAKSFKINTKENKEKKFKPIEKIVEKENKSFEMIYPVVAIGLALVMISFFLYAVTKMPMFGDPNTPANSSEVIKRYIESGLEETGAVNIVAGVILDYRAFDTLGESHVLFTAATVVTLLLLAKKEEKEDVKEKEIMETDPILKIAAKVLTPIILVFGIYVILCGHLGPGGGFSGGSIIGAGLILYSVAYGTERIKKIITPKVYKIITLSALCFYSFAKCYSFFCGANHLETIFTTGTPGAILSAGLILPLNIAVGIVVSLTMYGFYCYFTRRHI
ncbi:MAG: MnhB domain-containing protein [Erysipelotrichaceae bacterium]|nr:MnhB domain-containing protein [Erysipelotrichaceae bacterium]